MALGRVVQKFEIEMSGSTKQFMVSAKQGDRATRYVEVTLLSDGEPYSIPEGSSVTAYIRKPDRKRVYTACSFSGAVVTLELTSQTLAAAGTARCEIEVKSADLSQVITSVTFEIEIEPMVKDEDAVISGDEMSVLDRTLKQYAEAEANRVSAESKRAQAETARANAEKERANAEKERANAETARADAETARKNAETARANAESARVQAEGQRQQNAQEVLEKANNAVKVAGQINEASYILDADSGTKYAYAIYAQSGKPHMTLTKIIEG